MGFISDLHTSITDGIYFHVPRISRKREKMITVIEPFLSTGGPKLLNAFLVRTIKEQN